MIFGIKQYNHLQGQHHARPVGVELRIWNACSDCGTVTGAQLRFHLLVWSIRFDVFVGRPSREFINYLMDS